VGFKYLFEVVMKLFFVVVFGFVFYFATTIAEGDVKWFDFLDCASLIFLTVLA
jgi:hypothetical protein